MIRNTFIIFALLSSICACSQESKKHDANADSAEFPIQKTEAEWKAQLNAMQYHVLREKGTERAFSGQYNDFKVEGTFHCAACNTALFGSETKYDSKSGWPSFYDVLNPANVKEIVDQSHGMRRTEVVCGQCGGHLGHVFEDGPQPTGLRYCINSVSLQFTEE